MILTWSFLHQRFNGLKQIFRFTGKELQGLMGVRQVAVVVAIE
jgi:hypothetical protein